MKLKFIQSLLFIVCLTLTAGAADGHDHQHENKKAGPTGGKLITDVKPYAEFFVNKDKKVEIRFVDEQNKVVPTTNQVITVIMGDRSAPTRLSFSKDGDKLISDKSIPEGNELPTVVQIKSNPSSKTVTEKFNLNLSKCPACENAEYACVCSHGENSGSEHKESDGHNH